MLSPGEKREDSLAAFAQDEKLKILDRIQAAGKLSPGDQRDQILLAFTQNQKFKISDRIEAADKLSPGERRENILVTFTEDKSLTNDNRVKAGFKLSPGDKRDTIIGTFGEQAMIPVGMANILLDKLTSDDLREIDWKDLAHMNPQTNGVPDKMIRDGLEKLLTYVLSRRYLNQTDSKPADIV